MKLGKLSNDKLDSLILSKFGHMRKEVVCSPHVGVDCAAVDLGGRIAVLSTDPITAADKNIGSLTVHVSCNDAAARQSLRYRPHSDVAANPQKSGAHHFQILQTIAA